jgi:hypothetical protein
MDFKFLYCSWICTVIKEIREKNMMKIHPGLGYRLQAPIGHLHVVVPNQRHVCRVFASSSSNEDVIPPNCTRYTIKVPKPIGIVLEQTASGLIRVAEISETGSAARTGKVSVNDILIATSGIIKTTEQVYGETVVQGGEKLVRMTVQGQKFDTVLAAIGSHLAGMEVEMEFQRCDESDDE